MTQVQASLVLKAAPDLHLPLRVREWRVDVVEDEILAELYGKPMSFFLIKAKGRR